MRWGRISACSRRSGPRGHGISRSATTGTTCCATAAIRGAIWATAETLHGGLSEFGRAAIGELNRLGMLVDISHTSQQTALQAAMLSKTPVLATHSCVRALCDVPRNVDDLMLDALRDCGGMVNVTAVPSFLRPGGKAEKVAVRDFVDHVDYVVRRVGLAHAGISSDFDGGGGFSDWHDAADSPNLTAELVRRGYGEEEIAALWGGNFLRLLRMAEDGGGWLRRWSSWVRGPGTWARTGRGGRRKWRRCGSGSSSA